MKSIKVVFSAVFACVLMFSASSAISGGCNSGGPDAFGYTYCDSNDAVGPTFAFVDISTTGVSLALADDDEGTAPIGFNFDFYGTTQTSLFIVSNGHITFSGGSSGAFTNNCPLNGSSPIGIFPYWDDLDPADDGALAYYETFAVCPYTGAVGASGQCMVVQWDEFDRFPGDGVPGGTAGTFQAILFESGDIVYQYQTGFLLDGQSGTTAISNDGAANSLLYNCDTSAVISPELAVQFSAPGGAVANEADLSISVADSADPVSAGTSLSYTVTVDNAGPDDATNVVVTDMLPAGLTLTPVTTGCAEDPAGTPTCSLGTITSGGNASFTITFDLPSDAIGDISNTASVTATEDDPDTSNNSATETTTVVDDADLAVTITDNVDPVVAGSQLTYTVDVTNNGPADANGQVVVSNMLPAGLSLVSTNNCQEDPNGSPTCTLGSLALNASTSFTITADVDLLFSGTLNNTVTVSRTGATGVDPLPANDSATETTTVTAAESDLVLTISNNASQPLRLGNTFDFTMDLSNVGPQENPNVVVSALLSDGLEFITSGAQTLGGACATANANMITWNAGNLAVGASTGCSITVRVTFSGDQSLTASANGDVGDPIAGNSTSIAGTVSIEAIGVPTLSAWSLLFLMLLTLCIAMWSLQRRNLS